MVDIVIPTLNEELYIARCLESVYHQSFPFNQMNIMIIDGGSTDKTREIVEEYANKFPNVKLIHNPMKIQSAAFNIGYKQSSAPILIRLDAHALYNKDYVKRCITHIGKDDNIGNVGGVCDIQPQNNTKIAIANALLNHSRFGIGGASFRVGTKEGYVDTVPFGAFPRRVIDIIGGMREDLPRGEDNEYNYRIRSAGFKILLDPQIISTYFARNSISSSMKQMYQNGLSIARLTDINVNIISIRHFVPLLFVLIILAGIAFSWIWMPIAILFSCIMLLYFVLNLAASLVASYKHGLIYIPLLFIMFPLIHISYGCGTLKCLWEEKKCKYGYLGLFILPFHVLNVALKLIIRRS